MTRRLLAGVGAFVLVAAVGWAGTPAPTPTPDQLAAQLGANTYAEREAAAAALEAAGPAAVPALEAAARSSNPEVARRAAGILAKIRRATDSRTRLAAKTVRLDFKAVPLGAAVGDLKALTGINLALDPAQVADPLRPVTCATGELPVWEAVEAFCRAAGLREVFAAELEVPKQPAQQRNRSYYTPPPPPPAADAVPVVLADGKSAPLPGSRATAVRVLALPPSFPGHRVTLGTGDVTMQFDVTPAPGLNWQEVAGVRVTKVIDDAGRFGGGGSADDSPAAGNPFGQQVFWGGGGFVQVWNGPGQVVMWDGSGPVIHPAFPNPRVVGVPLKLATPAARSLRLLEGSVVGTVTLPNQELVAVESPAASVGAEFDGPGGVRLTVLEAGPGARGVAVVRVRVDVPSPSASQRRRNPFGPVWPEQSRGPMQGCQVRAVGADGKPIAAPGGPTEINDDGTTQSTHVQLTLPRGSTAPAKLVLVGPKPVAVEVPFRMENVLLP